MATRATNPFSDLSPISPRGKSQGPPEPPPKSYMAEAVRETVTHRAHHSQNSPPRGRRTQSHDAVLSAAAALEKGKKTTSKKKSSQHADVIDRLDFTGIGAMVHHDGPFDACAPSRNRHRQKAPMLAWRDDGPYAAAADPFPEASEPPRRKVDAIAEAWGKHEPEPFEEFFAGGGTGTERTPSNSIYNGHTPSRSARREPEKEDPRERYKRQVDADINRLNKRTPIPPPQPIFTSEPEEDYPPPSSPPLGSSGSAPKRSKSLMHRIRKMRDAPNVPADEETSEKDMPPSPNERPERMTHRPQHSFPGRFFNDKGRSNSDFSGDEKGGPSPLAYEAVSPVEYFGEQPSSGAGMSPSSPGATGLGRKTSLLKKVRGVVTGQRA